MRMYSLLKKRRILFWTNAGRQP